MDRGEVLRVLLCYGGHSEFQPLVKAAVQSPDPFVSSFDEHSRQTGARGLVGSSAIENDFLVLWYEVGLGFELRGRNSKCAGNHQPGT